MTNASELREFFTDADAKWSASSSPTFDKKVGATVADAALDALLGPTTKTPHVVALVEAGQTELAKFRADKYGDDESIMAGFHPSFISGSTCQAAYYYNKTSKRTNDVPPKLQRIFDAGTDAHTRVQQYLTKYLVGTWQCRKCRAVHNQHAGYYHHLQGASALNDSYKDELLDIVSHSDTPIPVPAECSRCHRRHDEEYNGLFVYKEWRILDTEYGIVGKTDGLLLWKGSYVPIEIKSANSATCRTLAKKGVSPKYADQFKLYMFCLARQLNVEIPVGVFIYWNKDTQDLYEIECWIDKTEIQPILSRCLLAKESRGDAILTDECRDCPYTSVCIADGRREA
jgi:hypothetical protein